MTKVAFIGLGVMGYHMAGHLRKKGGHDVTVYNRTQAKAQKWVKAFGGKSKRTPREAMLRMRENLPGDDSWNREARGIWDPVKSAGVIPPADWAKQGLEHSIATSRFALGVECGPDLAWASVAFAGARPDGSWHFELDEDQHTKGRGVAWLVPHLEKLLADSGGNLPAFYARVKELAASERSSRDPLLAQTR